MTDADELLAAGWVRCDGFECGAELTRPGLCVRPGRWFHPRRNLRGRPMCTQHALRRERDERADQRAFGTISSHSRD